MTSLIASRAGGDVAQSCLDLGPARLDRIEVGRVSRQEADLDAGCGEGGQHTRAAVGGEPVEHDDGMGTALERRQQYLLDKGQEHLGVGRARHGHHRHQPADTERAQQGEPAPVAGRSGGNGPLAVLSAGVTPDHGRVDAALIQENQVLGGQSGLGRAPRRTVRLDVVTLLLARVQGLFFRRQPSR